MTQFQLFSLMTQFQLFSLMTQFQLFSLMTQFQLVCSRKRHYNCLSLKNKKKGRLEGEIAAYQNFWSIEDLFY